MKEEKNLLPHPPISFQTKEQLRHCQISSSLQTAQGPAFLCDQTQLVPLHSSVIISVLGRRWFMWAVFEADRRDWLLSKAAWVRLSWSCPWAGCCLRHGVGSKLTARGAGAFRLLKDAKEVRVKKRVCGNNSQIWERSDEWTDSLWSDQGETCAFCSSCCC